MKNIKNLLIFLLFSFIISNAKSQKRDCGEWFSSYDTITLNGNYLKYHMQGKVAQMEYGNNHFQRYLPEEYSCDLSDARIPKFKWDNNDFICLKYGCGSPCWGVKILPLNINDSIRNIMYDLAWDPGNNILVYLGEPDYNSFIIENLKSKTRQKVELSQKCDETFLGYCIDSISVNKKELYYRFAITNNFDDNKKLTEYRVNIK